MATVYGAPEHIKCPQYKDFLDKPEDLEKAEKEYTKAVVDFCKSESNCPHAGAEIFFVVGDGCAQYIVYNYRTLIFVGLDDAYQIPDAHARGLRKDDILKAIQRCNTPVANFMQK